MFGYRSCPECGVAVQAARLATAEHDCSAERRIAHQLLRGVSVSSGSSTTWRGGWRRRGSLRGVLGAPVGALTPRPKEG